MDAIELAYPFSSCRRPSPHRKGRIAVAPGQALSVGDLIGECGNTDNSTETHLPLQAIDRLDVAHAKTIPITFPQGLPRNGDIVDAAGDRRLI